MNPGSASFVAATTLTEIEPTRADRAFQGTTQPVPWPKAYGGDMVTQALAAAMRTVDADRSAHSMHGYFLRPAAVGHPLTWEVELVRDGRGYSSRSVRGYQDGRAVFASLLSFQAPEDSRNRFAASPPASVPGPDELPTSAETLAGVDTPAAAYWSSGRSFDMRHVPGPLYLPEHASDGEAEPGQAVWVRAFDALPDDPRLHQLAIAYVCDYTILESLLRAVGFAWLTPGLATASIDHAMWLHRPARADEWLLYAQSPISLQHGRGLAEGRFFTRDGGLVATVVQEGVIRTVS